MKKKKIFLQIPEEFILLEDQLADEVNIYFAFYIAIWHSFFLFAISRSKSFKI